MKVKITKDFRFAEDGIHVLSFAAGETAELTQACFQYALQHGFIEMPKPAVEERKRQAFTSSKLSRK
jgi:hypothetical protein